MEFEIGQKVYISWTDEKTPPICEGIITEITNKKIIVSDFAPPQNAPTRQFNLNGISSDKNFYLTLVTEYCHENYGFFEKVRLIQEIAELLNVKSPAVTPHRYSVELLQSIKDMLLNSKG